MSAVIILAVLAIGAGDRPPELPTSPRPSTRRAASPCAGQGNAGAVPTCSTAETTEVAAVTGSGRKYWKAAAASSSASRYGSGRRTSELCASARRSAVRPPASRALRAPPGLGNEANFTFLRTARRRDLPRKYPYLPIGRAH